MPFITVGQENSGPIQLYYEDLGSGQPVILIHGWPLSGASWEKQTAALLHEGYRVITYDRRGFGQSSKPSIGYHYDTFAEDLHQVITQLDLKDVCLAGFSMGGGEVARYIGKHGTERISKVAILGGVPPYLVKADDNPTGVDRSVFESIKKSILEDRPSFMSQFFKDFYNVEEFIGKRISEEVLRMNWNIAVEASPIAVLESVDAWIEDFRDDVAKIDVPALIIHGSNDRIVPIESSGRPLAQQMKNARYVEIDGAPHGFLWTHANEVCWELVSFFGPPQAVKEEPRRIQPSQMQ